MPTACWFSAGDAVAVEPSSKVRGVLVDVGDRHGHGDRVVGGAGEPVGDLDDDDAGVGVVAGAAAGRLEVRGVGEGQDAAVGDAEQVVVDAGGVVAGRHDGVGEGRRPVRVGGRVGADGLLVLGRVGRGRVAVREDGRGLVGVGDRHGDRLGRRVGGARAVRGGDDDHVVLAAAVGGGRLVVGDAVGLEPELGVAVDLEEVGVGAAGDREGHGVAGVGVGRGEFTTTFWTFSAMVGVALDVKAGSSSLTSWTVTVTVIVSSSEPASPSETLMTTTQVLASLTAPQPGVSKSGALLNVRTPPLATLNRSWSTLAALSPDGHDGVGEGRRPVRVGGRVGAGRR